MKLYIFKISAIFQKMQMRVNKPGAYKQSVQIDHFICGFRFLLKFLCHADPADLLTFR